MPRKPIRDRAKDFEKGIKKKRQQEYVLRLYVAGLTPAATRAILNIKEICEQHLEGRYDLQVIDIYQQPALAEGEQIIAVPTLVKQLPQPLRKFIGDLSDPDKLLFGLDVKQKG